MLELEGEVRVKNQFSSPISDQGPAAASFGLFGIVASSGFMSEEISASCALIRRSGLRWLWRTLTKPSGFRTSLLLGHQLHPLKPSLRHGSQPSGCSNGSSRLKFGRRVVEPEGEVKGSAATLRMSSRASRVSRCPMGGGASKSESSRARATMSAFQRQNSRWLRHLCSNDSLFQSAPLTEARGDATMTGSIAMAWCVSIRSPSIIPVYSNFLSHPWLPYDPLVIISLPQ